MSQMRLPFIDEIDKKFLTSQLYEEYATDETTSCEARVALERKHMNLFQHNSGFSRKLVSYQGNKDTKLHNWLKYKEGFSAQLVSNLINDFNLTQPSRILDPFAGSATTLLVAQAKGLDAVGIEILPACHLAWEAKSNYREYDLNELLRIEAWLQTTLPSQSHVPFPHIPITESAFPADQEQKLMWYVGQVNKLTNDNQVRNLLNFTLMSVLEEISFTRKDGQYLRWDSRSRKAQLRDQRRVEAKKSPYKPFFKGELQDISQAFVRAFSHIVSDIKSMQEEIILNSEQNLIKGSALEVLPRLAADHFDAIITSPPYCNRYDYTRTYALELAFLGLSHEAVVNLRQAQLSCTVENHSKLDELQAIYRRVGREQDFTTVMEVVESNDALQEVFNALETRGERGDLNNKGIIQMVKGYFTELAFITFELFRVCRTNAFVAIVNDNVRYAGEIIPVDLLMTDIAVAFGFHPEVIYILPQRKGNSSQQMGKFGREALRKSILVWKKTS